jgi:hypothetical protein
MFFVLRIYIFYVDKVYFLLIAIRTGHQMLVAIKAVQESAPFPRAPQGMFSYPVRMRIGVSFELI